MRIQSWAPGHATLLFAATGKETEPLYQGSLGVGLNFETGVLTTIEESNNDEIKWNNTTIDGRVTQTAIDKFREMTGFEQNLVVNHNSELKIGYGLSTSGAGAIGVVLAMDALADTNMGTRELYQIAHYADVVNHTGLGSVMGQITGGIEIRTSIGGPGVGEMRKIEDDSTIVILMMGGLKTSDILVSKSQMKQVNSSGEYYLQKLLDEQNINLQMVMDIGKKFTKDCGLMTNRVKEILEKLNQIGEDITSMAMIGETIIVKPNDLPRVIEFAHKYRIDAVVTKITNSSPGIVNTTT